MKSILYAGAALMLAAGIYGFVDYKKSNKNADFKKMFEEEKIVEPGVPINENSVMSKEEVAPLKKSAERPARTKTERTTTNNKRDDETNREKKSRELSPELFSRAPLKEIPKERISGKAEKTGKSKKSE